MKNLLDTNILIDHLRGRKSINPEIIQAGSAISVITLGELHYGAFKSENWQKSMRIINEMIVSLDLEVVNLTKEMVLEFGEIKADLEKSGQRLEDFDLLIAATALVSNLILVTNDTKHFQRVASLKLSP